jgi:hypothetical protein
VNDTAGTSISNGKVTVNVAASVAWREEPVNDVSVFHIVKRVYQLLLESQASWSRLTN